MRSVRAALGRSAATGKTGQTPPRLTTQDRIDIMAQACPDEPTQPPMIINASYILLETRELSPLKLPVKATDRAHQQVTFKASGMTPHATVIPDMARYGVYSHDEDLLCTGRLNVGTITMTSADTLSVDVTWGLSPD